MTTPEGAPPVLKGFDFKQRIGRGGFADVFLYAQHRPVRDVAVKVLREAPKDPADQRRFDDEADRMASVSAHPYIVAVYSADIAEDGRPYLVMEYYAREHFGDRLRRGGLPVRDVLRVGIQVASAVEAAHREGILHRDIKPANILVNQWGNPGLTDFGIAGTRAGGLLEESDAVSLPYAPPEVLAGRPGDERGDVYALGATLYALLAGHSPFEWAGQKNTVADVEHRTLTAEVPPTGRSDVPRSLENLLRQAMAKEPAARPRAAIAFAFALQEIERELQYKGTDLELGTDEIVPPPLPKRDDDLGTRASSVQVISQPSAPVQDVSRPLDGTATRSSTRLTGTDELVVPQPVAVGDTHHRDVVDPESTLTEAPDRRKPLVVGAVAAALGAVLLGVVLTSGGGGVPDARSSTTVTTAVLSLIDDPRPPKDLAVTDGSTVIRWTPVDEHAGDAYRVQRSESSHADDRFETSTSTSLRLPGLPSGQACFKVSTVRGDRVSEPSDPVCTVVGSP